MLLLRSVSRPLAALAAVAALAACERNDLQEPPVPLGNFALGLNVVVADKMEKVPISRTATVDEWETAVKQAIDDRFGRYEGEKLYNIGISVDGYALAPPGIPVIAAPKSVLVVTANIWDDAAQLKLNPEGKRMTIFESLSAENVIGTGLTRSKKQQMDALSYNVAKAVEKWILENPTWVGLPAPGEAAAATEAALTDPAAVPAAAQGQAPAAGAAPATGGTAVTQAPVAAPSAAPVAASTPAAPAVATTPAPPSAIVVPGTATTVN